MGKNIVFFKLEYSELHIQSKILSSMNLENNEEDKLVNNLLQKTRKLNKTLQSYGNEPISFNDISKILSEILDANVYIASKKGKVLGYQLSSGFQ